MKKLLTRLLSMLIPLTLVVNPMNASAQAGPLPLWSPQLETTASNTDWLVRKPASKAQVYQSPDQSTIILANGLLKREFVRAPNLACISYKNLINQQDLIRAVKPEAEVTINGTPYRVGGLLGQPENAYFQKQWLARMTTGSSDFQLADFSIAELVPFLPWKAWAWSGAVPTVSGKKLTFHFRSSLPSLKEITVDVNYQLYDGLPLLVKWVDVHNQSGQAILLNQVKNEILGIVEEESAVVGSVEQMAKPQGIYLETNYAFNNAMRYAISDQTTHWKTDSTYTSQVNYNFTTPCLLEVYPSKGIGTDLAPHTNFSSIRTYALLMDSYDRERRGLAIRKMYRTISPWIAQNPIFMHLVSRTDEQVFTAIDQCAATGYEALILSFGSHCTMEDTSEANLSRWKQIADYAHRKNVRIGSYSLFSSRKIDDTTDVINPLTGKPGGTFFGNAPCFGSYWGLAYRDKIKKFISTTGFDIWENDGPYPGDVCASTRHPGHRDVTDSQWKQMEIQKELYHWLTARGVYINAPDWYFLDGTHKIAVGYREVNFSLPREQQKVLNRQNIYDGTWEKTPSMGWGFVPLTVYQGGGPEAVLEPLSEHLADYEQLMVQYYGAGVQACYRGPRLYDTDRTQAVVSRTIAWYKTYREILNSDIVHLRRPDGRDWDGIMHVNPDLRHKGFVLLYNPTSEVMTRTVALPVYYTGLSSSVQIREKEGKPRPYKVDRDHRVSFTFTLPPNGYSWYVLE